jgi:hypothetical protein
MTLEGPFIQYIWFICLLLSKFSGRFGKERGNIRLASIDLKDSVRIIDFSY